MLRASFVPPSRRLSEFATHISGLMLPFSLRSPAPGRRAGHSRFWHVVHMPRASGVAPIALRANRNAHTHFATYCDTQPAPANLQVGVPRGPCDLRDAVISLSRRVRALTGVVLRVLTFAVRGQRGSGDWRRRREQLRARELWHDVRRHARHPDDGRRLPGRGNGQRHLGQHAAYGTFIPLLSNTPSSARCVSLAPPASHRLAACALSPPLPSPARSSLVPALPLSTLCARCLCLLSGLLHHTCHVAQC